MKYKLLCVSKYPIRQNNEDGLNIGDSVQALAASQFYPHVDGFIDRDEELHCYDGEQCKMIMNGWYMHQPQNWPPTDAIDPLFVAFHVNSESKDVMLSDAGVEYLKRHEPIGCRDFYTLHALQDKGIDAYFSGCLTLTLGERYRTATTDSNTYIVDPLFNGRLTLFNLFKSVLTMVCHPKDIFQLLTKKGLNFYKGNHKVKNALKVALYYRVYSKVFSGDIIANSEYITQQSVHYMNDFSTDQDRLNEAERLIRMYAKASLIITSRIHCALPSLGLETPVIFIVNEKDSLSSSCRFDGLKELMNTVSLQDGCLVPQFEMTRPITLDNIPVNKDSWKELAVSLAERCRAFMKS